MKAWLTILLSTTLAMSVANAQPRTKTNGVRARLYWIGTEIDPEDELAANQSPNLDQAVPNFLIQGNEPWFKTDNRHYEDNYVLVLEASVRFKRDDEVDFRLYSEATAILEIDGAELATSEDGDEAVKEFEPTSEFHRIRIIQYVNDEPRELGLEWKLADEEAFAPIPNQRLTTAAFYFRPTNGAAKRMAQSGDRPGRYEKVAGVFPGCELMTIRPPGVEVPVGGLDLLPDGRLVVAMFDARGLRAPAPQEESNGELWLYSHVAADERSSIQRQRIAEGLFEPCGVCVVGEAIYVSQRSQITRFDCDENRHWHATTVAEGWETNDFHALSFGLVHRAGERDHPGYLFMARGTGLGRMKNPPNHGSIWRVDLGQPAGTNVEPLTGGHRTPNGIGIGPDDQLFVTDNQGEWTPANELNHVVQGSFYGFQHRTDNGGSPTPFQDEPTTQPAIILPQDEIANSPSEPVLIPSGWPFAGQMLVGDVKYGGINRISLEKVGGRWQGAVYRFSQGLEGGSNRLVFDDRGHLFVGAIGGDHASSWNWVNRDGEKTYQGLQRLKTNGRAVFDLECITITKRGFRIKFTEPVAPEWLHDLCNYRLSQWRYVATADYGGPKIDIRELDVLSAKPDETSQAVDIEVAGHKPGHVIHFDLDAVSAKGEPIWSAEAWYTLWRLPEP
jgi:glucose/arabinose dehydrogenase